MRLRSLLTRSTAYFAVLAALIATAATVYATIWAFQALDTAPPTWRTSIEGTLRAIAATAILLPVAFLLTGLYELARGPR